MCICWIIYKEDKEKLLAGMARKPARLHIQVGKVRNRNVQDAATQVCFSNVQKSPVLRKYRRKAGRGRKRPHGTVE
jgi:hypothetical protein